MKKVFFIFLLVLVAGCGIRTRYSIIRKEDVIRKIEIESPQKKLKVGEKFTYKAEWMGIDVGIAYIMVKEIKEMNGRQVYHIQARAETTPLISKVYRVEDEISTYLDVEKLYPLRFEKKQREGNYRADDYVDFDHENGMAYYFSRLNNSRKEYPIPSRVHDPLSCIYYFRLQDVDIGRSVFAEINVKDKNYLLEAKILKKGIISIDGVGEWEAFMVEPLPWFQGKIQRRAKATIWFSADDDRVPLLIVTTGIPFVGTITITLQKIEYL